MALAVVNEAYRRLKRVGGKSVRSDQTRAELLRICDNSLAYIREYAELVPLVSKVMGKEYVVAREIGKTKTSRPVNSGLFDLSLRLEQIQALLAGDTSTLAEPELQRHLYTTAMSYLVLRDLVADGDRRTTASFFEFLIAHLVSNKLGVEPTTSIQIPSLDIENRLPTDFIFDLGHGETKVHMPVKISTRERVVQAWAHQRVLEGMHGAGRFRGIMVVLTETNKQDKDNSVVEVLLPGQWAAYQMYISMMYRIYYFDLPKPYEVLRDRYPHIPVWPFARFFVEYENIGKPPIY